MNRENLIQRLVDRKMTANEKAKPFCVCMARRLCFGAGQRSTTSTKK